LRQLRISERRFDRSLDSATILCFVWSSFVYNHDFLLLTYITNNDQLDTNRYQKTFPLVLPCYSHSSTKTTGQKTTYLYPTLKIPPNLTTSTTMTNPPNPPIHPPSRVQPFKLSRALTDRHTYTYISWSPT
jgi:hypothetical protein